MTVVPSTRSELACQRDASFHEGAELGKQPHSFDRVKIVAPEYQRDAAVAVLMPDRRD